jgi:2-polyprenyl-3-methyl-5-hydroxy-6-metoxy-1,4-benzoquinol methylase
LEGIVRCGHCELTFTNPRPALRDIGRFYPPDYACYDVTGSWDIRRRARWRRAAERQVLRAFFKYPPQPAGLANVLAGWLGRAWIRSRQHRCGWLEYRGTGRLLDFGCGAGSFLRRMQTHGWRVEGLDVSADVAAQVERQAGIRVHVGTLPHADLDSERFDCLTMWQALEHVHQPREVLESARQVLRPGGAIVITVPNIESWSFRTFGAHWFALDVPRHLTHFAPHTLSRLLASAGFGKIRIQHVGMDGWLRQSGKRAAAAPDAPRWLGLCRWKPLALRLARWTERRSMADNILAIAQRK